MRNRWVIPDIHGCSKTLKCLIENNINLSKEDSVYFLGDQEEIKRKMESVANQGKAK